MATMHAVFLPRNSLQIRKLPGVDNTVNLLQSGAPVDRVLLLDAGIGDNEMLDFLYEHRDGADNIGDSLLVYRVPSDKDAVALHVIATKDMVQRGPREFIVANRQEGPANGESQRLFIKESHSCVSTAGLCKDAARQGIEVVMMAYDPAPMLAMMKKRIRKRKGEHDAFTKRVIVHDFESDCHYRTHVASLLPTSPPNDGWHVSSSPFGMEGIRGVRFEAFCILNRNYCPELAHAIGVPLEAVNAADPDFIAAQIDACIDSCFHAAMKMQQDSQWAFSRMSTAVRRKEGYAKAEVIDMTHLSLEETVALAKELKDSKDVRVIMKPCACGGRDCLCKAVRRDTMKTVYLCAYCQMPGKDLQQCVRCKKARYCGKQCQKADWKKHRPTCDA